MRVSSVAAVLVIAAVGAVTVYGQIGGVQGGGRGRAGGAPPPPSNLPSTPTAVALPTLSPEVTGPGPMFDSTPSLAPGKGLAAFGYETHEYLISGTANGEPYTTRMVVRRPADMSKFSGLVLAEAMHGSGSAHMFEFTSIYLMSSGHAAVEILTTPPAQFVALNEPRYRALKLSGAQTNEILAQAGALVRAGSVLGAPVRKMVLGGTSMTAAVTINYIPAHMVYRTSQMQRIYDGFLPMSNGSLIGDADVPIIHVPTMHEVSGNITNRQDSDAPGKQYRLYEFSGMGHIDTRDSVRLKPNPCQLPLSAFPVQAYMSVALSHLLTWVDKGDGAAEGRAHPDRSRPDERWVDDGAGRERQPARRHPHDVCGRPDGEVHDQSRRRRAQSSRTRRRLIANGGQQAADLMCRLSTSQTDLPPARMKALYKTKQGYTAAVAKRLTELEKAGWSLPVYREMILADAAKVTF